MKPINIIIVSGLSGSGKTTVLKALEDLGFYCVDNLPVLLLPKFLDLCQSSTDDITRIALGMDVRERSFLNEYRTAVNQLRADGYRAELIFLESKDEVLIQRFSETRRSHPLSENGSVREGIQREREKLHEIKALADRIFDTSEMNVHQLRDLFNAHYEDFLKRDMSLTFLSFGFKYGVPHDSDLVFDVRFLPNPYFVNELKFLDGKNEKVAAYVLEWPETSEFLTKLKDLLSFQIPLYEREGKAYLTVSIGCTGGKHRSVAIAQILKDHFLQKRPRVHIIHRDCEKS